MKGRKIFEYELDITRVVDTGVSLNEILSGAKTIPPQGLRMDVHFKGKSQGEISGTINGVDYAQLRADGRLSLDIRAMIEVNEHTRIAINAGGVAVLREGEPIADLCENVTLSTASETYAWVNNRQVWSIGTVDFEKGKILLAAYIQ